MTTDLHTALQRHYAGEDGLTETWVGGVKVDVLREGIAYEVQLAGFGQLRPRLEAIRASYPVVIVYPLVAARWIVHLDPASGEEVGTRKSPKRAKPVEAFGELMRIADMLADPGLAVELVWVGDRALRCADGKGSWRRKGVSLVGRELIEVRGTQRLSASEEYLALLPEGLEEPFSVAELAAALRIPRRLAGKVAYTLHRMGALTLAGKAGNAHLYQRAEG